MHMYMHLHLHLHLHLLQVLVLSMSLMVLVSLPSTLAEVETGLDWGTGLSAGRGLPGVLGAWHNMAVVWLQRPGILLAHLRRRGLTVLAML